MARDELPFSTTVHSRDGGSSRKWRCRLGTLTASMGGNPSSAARKSSAPAFYSAVTGSALSGTTCRTLLGQMPFHPPDYDGRQGSSLAPWSMERPWRLSNRAVNRSEASRSSMTWWVLLRLSFFSPCSSPDQWLPEWMPDAKRTGFPKRLYGFDVSAEGIYLSSSSFV